jgi:hypothetical protein
VKLNVRHRFDCTPETFWEMYWDEAFDEALRAESGVTREILEEREDEGVLIRRIRITPDRELPGPAAALLGAKKLVYEQENKWDRAANVLHWRVIPTILPGKLDASGTFRVEAVPGGCEQVVEGNISVNVLFVGGQIEKAVVSEVEKSYDKTAAISRAWLKKRETEQA